jgi:hypothetical protein
MAPPTPPGPTRMRPEPTTAQELDSIVLRTTVGPTIGQACGCIGEPITVEPITVDPSSGGPIGQACGCIGEPITVGPSLGGPIGRRLLGASTGRAFGCPDHALGPFTGRQCAPLVQAIAPGSGGASRSETPLTGSRYRSRVHQSPVSAAAGFYGMLAPVPARPGPFRWDVGTVASSSRTSACRASKNGARLALGKAARLTAEGSAG